MSKSLGNVIDPKEIIKNESAEALRLWSATEGNLSQQDISCSRERIKGELKTINKLLNIAKFISQFKKPKKARLTALDKLFIDYIEELTSFSDSQYEIYDFYSPSIKLRHFLREIFASHYLELIKNRAYNEEKNFSKSEQESAHYTLHYILERLLILLSPIIPQITSLILESLKAKITLFPKAKPKKSDISLIEKIMEFNSYIWKLKKDNNLSLKSPVKDVKIPQELNPFEADLTAAHNLEAK